MNSLRYGRALITGALAGGVLVACATLPPPGSGREDTLAARVDAILARRGLGRDALAVIENVTRHELAPPPGAPPMVRQLLGQPLAVIDAESIFYRSVPAALRRLADESAAAPTAAGHPEPASLRELIDAYVAELAEAQRMLKSAATGSRIDALSLINLLGSDLPGAGRMRDYAAALDQAMIDRATTRFISATARFVGALRSSRGVLRFPEAALRFESPVGIVSIGTRGNDRHGPDAAVIIDPGGNDTYQRAPVTDGAVSVIIDLGGDDRYLGPDLVVHGLSAIVDFSGNDRYIAEGPAWGAAIAGAAVLIDFEGDDVYEAGLFGQGAAAFGLGALIDLAGNDSYRVRAGGQGLGMAGGTGLLWDRAGNDRYTVAGLPDEYSRGGGVSFAQGAAYGHRTALGGGIGILRDDAGDDDYQAEMFAQGVGYYYGIGLLWDGRGNDRYRAVRYAQGNGVHEAIGVLRDDAGDDTYMLTVGVGQGMGLDLAVGVLYDGAGDDRYEAQSIAQGAATANGAGFLIDIGGADEWRMGSDTRSWGRAEWARGLPSLALLLHDPSRAIFRREDRAVAAAAHGAEYGGPLGDAPIAREPQPAARCAAATPAAAGSELQLTGALRALAPGLAAGSPEPVLYGNVQRRLATRLRESLATLPNDDFDIQWALGIALHCTLNDATPGEAAAMWADMERLLAEEPATPFAGNLVGALRARPAPMPQMQGMLKVLEQHPRCGVRAGMLDLRRVTANDEATRAQVVPAAQTALGASCWRLQAAALDVLGKAGVAAQGTARLPTFLRIKRGAASPDGETNWNTNDMNGH